MANSQYSIEQYKNLTENKMITLVLRRYHKGIMIAAKKVKSKYKWIPLEFDDLFNVFSHQIPVLIQKYSEKFQTKFSTYILNNAFYFMANYARRYSTSRFKTLNERVRIFGKNLKTTIKKETSYHIFATLMHNHLRIDVSFLSSLEIKIMQQYFVHNMSISNIALVHKFSYNKTSRMINQIKRKIIINNKNLMIIS